MFVKKDRNKYVSLLSRSTTSTRVRVNDANTKSSDPAHEQEAARVELRVHHQRLEMCAMWIFLLDGAFQHYTQQRYRTTPEDSSMW